MTRRNKPKPIPAIEVSTAIICIDLHRHHHGHVTLACRPAKNFRCDDWATPGASSSSAVLRLRCRVASISARRDFVFVSVEQADLSTRDAGVHPARS
jgi:hypothetical protein